MKFCEVLKTDLFFSFSNARSFFFFAQISGFLRFSVSCFFPVFPISFLVIGNRTNRQPPRRTCETSREPKRANPCESYYLLLSPRPAGNRQRRRSRERRPAQLPIYIRPLFLRASELFPKLPRPRRRYVRTVERVRNRRQRESLKLSLSHFLGVFFVSFCLFFLGRTFPNFARRR